MQAVILFALTALFISPSPISAIFKFNSQAATLQLSGPCAQIIMSTPINNFNGTLKISDKTASSIMATTTNDQLKFSDGIYQINTSGRTYVNATIDPSNTDSIILNTGQSIYSQNGTVIESLLICGTGSSVNGQPIFNSPLILKDADTCVTICIQNRLNQNITLNGGTVILGDDLTLQDGVFFTGSGTLNLAHKNLTLPAAIWTPWASDITFLQASSISLTGFTNMSGQWTFSGAGDYSTINGSGCILDLTNGGIIEVENNHTLYIDDLHIKGIGSNAGNIIINPGGYLYLSNVVLELDGSYNFSSGTVIVSGGNCTLIAKNYDQFIISGSNTILNIDGVAMLYDPLGTTPLTPSPFVTSAGGTISFSNCGIIRASYSPEEGGIGGDLVFSKPTSQGTEELSESQILSATSTITFINKDTLQPKSITLDGKGFFIQFNYALGQFITLQENLTVTLCNILLKDFDPSLINFQGLGSTKSAFIFGDNVAISLGNDLSAPAAPFSFAGTSTLRGNGTTLTLDQAYMLTTSNPGSNLTVKNLKLVLTNPLAIQCLDNNATITLQDSELVITNTGIIFGQGNLDIKGNVLLSGSDWATPGGNSTFTFSSAGILTIQTASILQLSNRTNLYYNPNIQSDNNPSISKRHLQLIDPSATISVGTCNLTSGDMGLALDYGRLLINGQTTLCVSSAPGAEMEFGSALSVEIASGSILDINGTLMYTKTSYP